MSTGCEEYKHRRLGGTNHTTCITVRKDSSVVDTCYNRKLVVMLKQVR